MKNLLKTLELFAAFLLSFFAVGIPHWLIPLHQLNVPNNAMLPGLVVVGVASLIVRARGTASSRRTILLIGTAVPAAIYVRVAADCAHDPTAHNLWPFEVALASFVGYPCALAGAIAGRFLARRQREIV